MSKYLPGHIFAEAIKPTLKERGFKKSGFNWHKTNDDIIAVVNVQKSHWGAEFYVNLGVYIVALGSESRPPHNRCHIRVRLAHENRTPEQVMEEALAWFKSHGSIQALAALAKKDALPLMTSTDAKEYLRQNETPEATR